MNSFGDRSVRNLAQSTASDVGKRDAFALEGRHRASFPAMEVL
jgi:hypothetical protein